jgi:hypothetical protein
VIFGGKGLDGFPPGLLVASNLESRKGGGTMFGDDDEELKTVRLERQSDGSILVSFGEDSYELSENDAVVFADGLQRVAVNNPPDIVVHLECEERSAFLEFC